MPTEGKMIDRAGMLGRIIKNFRIDAVLGDGGMGVVYKAWDLVLERYVALKIIKFELAQNESFIKRLQAEAKILAKLKHPHLVHIYEFFEEMGNWHIVMEYIDGITVEKKIEQDGALSSDLVIKICQQVLSALDYAHSPGEEHPKIIHRDLKPSNIMLTRQDEVKITDFGLARIQDDSKLTQSSILWGTLFYMSPEQVNEEIAEIDHRTDIYALGITCYEMLAGRLPFQKTETRRKIANAIDENHFPPPTKFNSKVAGDLAKIVMKAMARKPKNRFQSAAEMQMEIKKLEVKAPPGPKWRPIFLIVWGVITVALILALVTIFAVPDLPLRLLKWVGLLSPTKVAIYIEPPGAEIKFDNTPVGKSPLPSRFVDVDTLHVSIRESTYFNIDSAIVVKGVTDTTLIFILRPVAAFTIAVVPESAEVMIDGKIIPPAQRGQMELTVGEHDLHIACAGYVTMNEKIFLRHGLNAPRVDTLKQAMIAAPPKPTSKPPVDTPTIVIEPPRRTGTLTLAIDPPSDVYIGNSLKLKTVTQESFLLPVGKNDIKVVHATLGKWEETIAMTEQGTSREIDFTKKYEIRITAFDSTDQKLVANIYVDGQPTNQLTPDALALNFGQHEIEVRKEGYETEQRKLNVEKNDELKFELKRSR